MALDTHILDDSRILDTIDLDSPDVIGNVDILDNFTAFQAIRQNWEAVYASDQQAQFFLSWVWLAEILQRYDEWQQPWLILAVCAKTCPSEYVAFFPLRLEVMEQPGGKLFNRFLLAGVTDAEYSGFICRPKVEAAVSSIFARWLQNQEAWSVFLVEHLQISEGRLSRFLEHFSTANFALREARRINDLDSIDPYSNPYLPLPENWEQYLQTVVSTNTRQKLKRFLRKVEDSSEFRITPVNAENLDQHIQILLELWRSTWEGRKGAEVCQRVMQQTSDILRHCFAFDCLYLPILWQGDRPLGAIACFLDLSHKTMLFYMAGRDDTFKEPPPGIVLHAYSIRYAMQQGFQVYDFLIGNEAYKFSFGAQERHLTTIVIERQNWLTSTTPLHPRTIPNALQIAATYHRSNRLAEAEQVYRQILGGQPELSEALYGLAVVKQRQGHYPTAVQVLNTLLQIQPNQPQAWFSLGTIHQLQAQLAEAEQAYRQALALQPETSSLLLAIYHNLGYTLQQQDRWDEAIEYYRIAKELQPGCAEAAVAWANALQAQGTLSAEQREHYAPLNLELGNRRQQAGDFKTAIEYYRQALQMRPDWVEAHYQLGRVWQGEGNWDTAIACYQTAKALQPDCLPAEVAWANASRMQGSLAPEQYGHYANLNYQLGNQYQQVGYLRLAIEFYEQALQMQPDWAEAHYQLGCVLQGEGNWTAAIACYQTAKDLKPNYLEAEVAWANALQAQGTLAAEQCEHYATLNYELGKQYQQSGNLSRSIEYYRQAIQLQSDWAEPRQALRLALEAQSNVKIKVSHAKQ